MSLRSNSSSRFGNYVSSGGFSSLSLGSYSGPKLSIGTSPVAPITPVFVNTSLLTPLKFDIDPSIQAVRTQEKDQIKSLNNRFASFIDKVRFLEQQNKMLETKWKLLQQQSTAPSDLQPMLKSYIASLQKQLDAIARDKERLDMENTCLLQSVDDSKAKYEDEINKRNWAENDFVMLKKDVDSIYLSRMCQEERVTTLAEEINFLHAVYDMELRELQDSLKQTFVVVEMDNSRSLNMDHIVSEVKAQYEEIAARRREDSESWYKTKFNQMSVQADQYSSEIHNTKGDISELNCLISCLQKKIEAVKGQQAGLESHISEAEAQGEQATKDAKALIKDLEEALLRAKQDMARQLRDYQELMNIKLALDIEISTYRKLLEGEEERSGQQSIVNIQSVPNRSVTVDSNQQSRLSAIVIKKVENFGIVTSYN